MAAPSGERAGGPDPGLSRRLPAVPAAPRGGAVDQRLRARPLRRCRRGQRAGSRPRASRGPPGGAPGDLPGGPRRGGDGGVRVLPGGSGDVRHGAARLLRGHPRARTPDARVPRPRAAAAGGARGGRLVRGHGVWSWTIRTAPWLTVQTVRVAPLRSTAVPRTATGPTSTPQIAAAISAATAMFALPATSTLPTATLTRPFWPWVMSALAGAAVAVMTAAPVARDTSVVRMKRVIWIKPLSCWTGRAGRPPVP